MLALPEPEVARRILAAVKLGLHALACRSASRVESYPNGNYSSRSVTSTTFRTSLCSSARIYYRFHSFPSNAFQNGCQSRLRPSPLPHPAPPDFPDPPQLTMFPHGNTPRTQPTTITDNCQGVPLQRPEDLASITRSQAPSRFGPYHLWPQRR